MLLRSYQDRRVRTNSLLRSGRCDSRRAVAKPRRLQRQPTRSFTIAAICARCVASNADIRRCRLVRSIETCPMVDSISVIRARASGSPPPDGRHAMKALALAALPRFVACRIVEPAVELRCADKSRNERNGRERRRWGRRAYRQREVRAQWSEGLARYAWRTRPSRSRGPARRGLRSRTA
jgi:hypothetical protein